MEGIIMLSEEKREIKEKLQVGDFVFLQNEINPVKVSYQGPLMFNATDSDGLTSTYSYLEINYEKTKAYLDNKDTKLKKELELSKLKDNIDKNTWVYIKDDLNIAFKKTGLVYVFGIKDIKVNGYFRGSSKGLLEAQYNIDWIDLEKTAKICDVYNNILTPGKYIYLKERYCKGKSQLVKVVDICMDTTIQIRDAEGNLFTIDLDNIDMEKNKKIVKKVLDDIEVGDTIFLLPNAYADRDIAGKAEVVKLTDSLVHVKYKATGEYNAVAYKNIDYILTNNFKEGNEVRIIDYDKNMLAIMNEEYKHERKKKWNHKPFVENKSFVKYEEKDNKLVFENKKKTKECFNLVYDGITLKHPDDNDIVVTRDTVIDTNEDLEKACMMYLLKKEGYTYTDVEKIMKNVIKVWKPELYEIYYYICNMADIESAVVAKPYNRDERDKSNIDNNNYFKTYEDAMTAYERLIKALKERR